MMSERMPGMDTLTSTKALRTFGLPEPGKIHLERCRTLLDEGLTWSGISRRETGGHRDGRILTLRARPHGGLRPEDRLLAEGEEPALGSHLVTPRLGYSHHGIYVGGGHVVHYGAFVYSLHRGPVEEIPVARFARGGTVWVRSPPESVPFSCQEVIRRARSRIGEDCYRLFSNNCEHFCDWCLNGTNRSAQVESWLATQRRLACALLAALLIAPCSPAWADDAGTLAVHASLASEEHRI